MAKCEAEIYSKIHSYSMIMIFPLLTHFSTFCSDERTFPWSFRLDFQLFVLFKEKEPNFKFSPACLWCTMTFNGEHFSTQPVHFVFRSRVLRPFQPNSFMGKEEKFRESIFSRTTLETLLILSTSINCYLRRKSMISFRRHVECNLKM